MEQPEMTMVGLLEILAFRSGCMYLSDLHQPRFLPAIRRALCNISPKQFSLWEWQDAVAYITEESHSFDSPEQLNLLSCSGVMTEEAKSRREIPPT